MAKTKQRWWSPGSGTEPDADYYFITRHCCSSKKTHITWSDKEIVANVNGSGGHCETDERCFSWSVCSMRWRDNGLSSLGLQSVLSGRALAAVPSLMVFVCTSAVCYIHQSCRPALSSPSARCVINMDWHSHGVGVGPTLINPRVLVVWEGPCVIMELFVGLLVFPLHLSVLTVSIFNSNLNSYVLSFNTWVESLRLLCFKIGLRQDSLFVNKRSYATNVRGLHLSNNWHFRHLQARAFDGMIVHRSAATDAIIQITKI